MLIRADNVFLQESKIDLKFFVNVLTQIVVSKDDFRAISRLRYRSFSYTLSELPEDRMLRIMLADSNETMRLGMKAVFERNSAGYAVAEAADRSGLMDELSKTDYNLVIVEPLMCPGGGEALIRQIRREAPDVNVLVYTDLDELKHGVRVIRSGARGYLMKNRPASELLAAANRVVSGKMHMSELLTEEVALSAWGIKQEAPHESLSEREKMVFAMLVCGKSITGISAALNLSCKTVSTHKARTLAKMQCKNLSELIEYAFTRGLKEDCEAMCKVW